MNTHEHTHTNVHSANIDRKYTSRHAGFECCCVTFFLLVNIPHKKTYYRLLLLLVLETLFYSDYFVLSHVHIHTYVIGYTIDSRTCEPTNTNNVCKWLKDRCVFSSFFLSFFFFSRLKQDICRRRRTLIARWSCNKRDEWFDQLTLCVYQLILLY